MTRTAKLPVAIALSLALPLFAACGQKAPTAAAGGRTVEVHLSDGEIQMPTDLSPGMTKFQVVNDGAGIHGFHIEGPAGDKEVATVQPGQKASLDMQLDPGTYRVSCPVGDNVHKGMIKAVNVTQG